MDERERNVVPGLSEGPDIGPFMLVSTIGRGSSGAVHLGRHRETGELVAIKALTVEWRDHSARQRFHRESRMLARLVHPNIVRFHEVIDGGDGVSLVTEYVKGTNLRSVLRHQKLKPTAAIAVISGLSAGLSHAHEHGIIHRDVSSANVLLSTDGDIKLGDFGIGKIVEGSMTPSLLSFRTATGALLGTPAYISPEAADLAVKQLTPAADLYSLGVLAYQLLVGVVPFPVGPDILATVVAHRSQAPPSPRLYASGFPETVEGVLLRALAKQPEQRQASVRTFCEQLRAAAAIAWPESEHAGGDLVGAVGLARDAERPTSSPPGVDGSLNVLTATRPAARAQAPAFRPRRRRMGRGVVTSVGLGVLTAGVVLLILFAIHV